ncbi:MAG: hypothetical protein EOP48_17250 [Sphingobacteriales bacterium]|nr:MAG: hypothetical protein EOP48_17250 [Sphingobacteriales bacterium]
MEEHPYLSQFKSYAKWRYLVIGTFPPNRKIRQDSSAFVDYFYGNRGSFWNVVDAIYPDYRLKKAKKQERVKLIQQWQHDYSIGITDTIGRCTRRSIKSFADADLIFNDTDLNFALRNYVLHNLHSLQRLYFTSTEGNNSAYQTFKRLMGTSFDNIPQEKLVITLPSPSNAVNISLFNKPSATTMGLDAGVYDYICKERQDLIPFYKARFATKQRNKGKQKGQKEEVPKSEKGLLV